MYNHFSDTNANISEKSALIPMVVEQTSRGER